MCGIVGYIGKREAAPILMEGLHRLEYRGYDSAGIALARNGKLQVYKSKGKVRELERLLPEQLKGTPGIAHTRWATHGEPSDRNAHPHCDARESLRHRSQRHHRERARAARAARKPGRRVPLRDRLGSARAPDRGHAGRHARRLGARRAAPHDRHLRPRGDRRAAAGLDRRRAQRQPGDARHRRSRDVRRLRCGGARAPHAERRASRRWRDRCRSRRRLSRHPRSTAARPRKTPLDDRLDRRVVRQGRLHALHAQGDRRAARSDPAHAERPARAALPDHASRRPGDWRRASCWKSGA